MIKRLLTGALRGIMQDLRMNPRNLRLYFITDHGEHLLARIDAKQVASMTSEQSRRRTLRVQLGDVAYDVELGL